MTPSEYGLWSRDLAVKIVLSRQLTFARFQSHPFRSSPLRDEADIHDLKETIGL